MTAGALSSDHVNYLILRYLQEAGHENAATAFYRDWHRQPEFRDPENYPFAPVVGRGELVNVIQDGLHHDELIARVKKNERRFQFTVTTTREGYERRDGAVFENGMVGSRPSSSAKRKGRPPTMRPPDEFPTPAPKRQRRSEGSEGVHLNGDVMDVDAASVSADPDDEGEPVSPAISAEPDMVEVPERYDSMDVAVQTEVKTGPKTSTMYWKVDKPNATIFHSVFNPSTDLKNTNTLLAVGESLCRFYQVPEDLENTRQVLSVDDPSIPPNSVITAATWHPAGHTAACGIDSLRELPDGRQESYSSLVSYSRDTGVSSQYLFPPLLEPAGIVLALRYSSNDNHLLVARTNLKRGLVLIYNTRETEAHKFEPIAWRIFEHQVLDATWAGANRFFVCGDNGLFEHLQITRPVDQSASEATFSTETISIFGLSLLTTELDEPPRKWDKVRFDDHTGIAALTCTEERRFRLDRFPPPGHAGSLRAWVDLPGHLTALAFHNNPSLHEQANLPLVALAFEEGFCTLYTTAVDALNNNGMDVVITVQLSEAPALAVAWSPRGEYLAVGGTDLVQIWEPEKLIYGSRERPALTSKEDSVHQPLVTWRPDVTATGPRNGEHLEDKPLTEPSLSWSADGESLAFAIDKQIAIIRFRPPLGQKDLHENGDLNGHGSP